MKNYKIMWSKIFRPLLPKIIYVNKIPTEYNPTDNGVAMYVISECTIYIFKKYRYNIAIKMHEYGHWLLVTVYYCLDELWEVIWWWMGIRKIFVKNVKLPIDK